MNELEYNVTGMTCQHCVNAVIKEVSSIQGVSNVLIDLDTKTVKVSGSDLQDRDVRAAIVEAGYEVSEKA